MGDKRRFDKFAEYIANCFPKTTRVADVAGGEGYLQQALRECGFEYVMTFDKRKGRRDRPRMRYQYRFFSSDVNEDFDLLVGMHPDEATDLIIVEAARRDIPFVIVPCCIRPSATVYWGRYAYWDWMTYLKQLAVNKGFILTEFMLRIGGKNLGLKGDRR